MDSFAECAMIQFPTSVAPPEELYTGSILEPSMDALKCRFEIFPPERTPAKEINSQPRGHSIFEVSQLQSRPRSQNQNQNQTSNDGSLGQVMAVNVYPF